VLRFLNDIRKFDAPDGNKIYSRISLRRLGKFNCGISCGALVHDNVSVTTNIVRAGVNYRF
jgi:hypothetical protein